MPRWRILERFKASPTNLMGPDFDYAPWYEIDLSGTKIKLKRPLTDVLSPFESLPKKWNIYDPDIYEYDEGGTLGCEKIFHTGWSFWQGYFVSEGKMGGGFLQINLDVRLDQPESINKSFFNSSYYKKWLHEDTKAFWDKYNKETIWDQRDKFIEEVDPDIDYWRYPESIDQIVQEEYNGHTWYRYDTFKLGRPHKRRCHLPISDHHQLSIVFEPRSYEYSYFDPATNIREATEQSRISFMQNLHIELSNDAKAQKQAVLDALKTTETIE